MTNERLVCIRTTDRTKSIHYKRLKLKEAVELVSSGEWCFISKSKYRRFMKELRNLVKQDIIAEDQSGIIIPNDKKVYPGIDKSEIVRPNKNGEIATQYSIHSAIKHLVSTDPLTGKKIYVKEGKGKVVKIISNLLKIK